MCGVCLDCAQPHQSGITTSAWFTTKRPTHLSLVQLPILVAVDTPERPPRHPAGHKICFAGRLTRSFEPRDELPYRASSLRQQAIRQKWREVCRHAQRADTHQLKNQLKTPMLFFLEAPARTLHPCCEIWELCVG